MNLILMLLNLSLGLGLAQLGAPRIARAEIPDGLRFIQVKAATKEQRTEIANTGVSIEWVRSDSIWGFATEKSIAELKEKKIQILGDFNPETGRGGHQGGMDFPDADSRFHNYQETTQELKVLAKNHADVARLSSIGQSVEGREIWALHINTSPEALKSQQSNKPGIIYMGNHHAREHLSLEIPLMLARYLLEKKSSDARISRLIDSRDIWILPMINPDGAEFDIQSTRYKWWRKNRRNNDNGTYGVDLNRNYSFMWGTGGSDKDPASDVYMGPAPFSEPETTAVKDFVDNHLNAKVLLTFHTFSELILYPWGHKYDPVAHVKDRQVFEKMARTMAQWNGYKPQQSSQLYIASGDTTDWAYGEHGIFAFTFELSPKSMWEGGFYPGAKVIDRVFQENLKPVLYMLDLADDPHRSLNESPSPWLKNYVEPSIAPSLQWERHPLPL